MVHDNPKTDYIKQTSIEHRKKYGQFFTPAFITEILTRWIINRNYEPHCVLDPAVGLGDLISHFPKGTRIDGFDIDQQVLSKAKATDSAIHLHNEDFLHSDWDKTYDGVICNPPYIRLRGFKEKQTYIDLFRKKLGVNISGSTNLYVFFLIKALHQLSEHGRAAFIIPSDFMNADYGVKIKEYLINKGNLHLVVAANFKMNWFDSAITTSSLLFFDNTHTSDNVEFMQVSSHEELAKLNGYIESFHTNEPIGHVVNSHKLDPTLKWRIYYQNSTTRTYKNIKPLSSFGKVTRGIATGANTFFCLTEQDQKHWGIEHQFITPCLTKAHQVKSNFFTKADFDQLLATRAPVQLLHLSKDTQLDSSIKEYLMHGEEKGYHERFLTKKRKPWYKTEERAPAPILVTVFSRSKVKFIRNEANVRYLTAFHGIYLHPAYTDDTDVLMAFFMTDICQELLDRQHREYGKGLKKFEPNDLNHALVIDIDALKAEDKKAIKGIYSNIRTKQLAQEDSSEEIEKVNHLFEKLI